MKLRCKENKLCTGMRNNPRVTTGNYWLLLPFTQLKPWIIISLMTEQRYSNKKKRISNTLVA